MNSLPKLKKKVRGAVIGPGQTGKTSFINTFCELYDDTPAPETPSNNSKATVYETRGGDISLADLPNFNNTRGERMFYAGDHNLKQFDFFVLILPPPWPEENKRLIDWLLEKVKELKKPYFIVRSKFDRDLMGYSTVKTGRPYAELDSKQKEAIISQAKAKIWNDFATVDPKTKQSVYENVYCIGRDTNSGSPRHVFDYPILSADIYEELSAIKKRNLDQQKRTLGFRFLDFFNPKLTKHYTNMDDFMEEVNQNVAETDSMIVTAAVIGVCGSGKSALINSLCGLYDTEYKMKEGIVETTVTVSSYAAIGEHFIVDDIPGVGTEKFPYQTYSKEFDLGKYDFIILVLPPDNARDTLKLNLKLMQHIKNDLKKPVFLVRSRIDEEITSRCMQFGVVLSPEAKDTIQQEVFEQAKASFPTTERVYIIGRDESHPEYPRHVYEYDELVLAIVEGTPKFKQEQALNYLNMTWSEPWIAAKEKLLESYMKKYSITSASGALCPIFGLSSALDATLIGLFIQRCKKIFCLEEEQLRKMVSPLVAMFLPRVAAIGGSVALAVVLATDDFIKFVPVVGTAVGMAVGVATSGPLMYFTLSQIRSTCAALLREVLRERTKMMLEQRSNDAFLTDDGCNTNAIN